eukprot:6175421-Pleurochrysis_carterae.AAC.1
MHVRSLLRFGAVGWAESMLHPTPLNHGAKRYAARRPRNRPAFRSSTRKIFAPVGMVGRLEKSLTPALADSAFVRACKRA